MAVPINSRLTRAWILILQATLLIHPVKAQLDSQLKVSYRLGEQKVSSNGDLDLTLQVTLKAPQASYRIPIALTLVIDQSSSIAASGTLASVQDSLAFVSKSLREDDFAGITSFGYQGEQVFPLTRSSDDFNLTDNLQQTIDTLQPDGSTNLADGLSLGLLEQLGVNVTGQIAQGILLFTDGQANTGVVREEDILATVQRLLADSSRPVLLYTVGLGDTDEILLDEIAQSGQGGFYYLGNKRDVPNAFGKVLGNLITSYFSNVKVTFDVSNETQINDIVTSGKVQGGKSGVNFADLQAEERRDFLVKVQIPQTKMNESSDSILKLMTKYTNNGLRENATEEIILDVEYDPENIGQDDAYIELTEGRFEVVDALKNFTSAASQGNQDVALLALDVAQNVVNDLKSGGIRQRLSVGGQNQDAEQISSRKILQSLNIDSEEDLEIALQLLELLEQAVEDAIKVFEIVQEDPDRSYLLYSVVDSVVNTLRDQRSQVLNNTEYPSTTQSNELYSSDVKETLASLEEPQLEKLPERPYFQEEIEETESSTDSPITGVPQSNIRSSPVTGVPYENIGSSGDSVNAENSVDDVPVFEFTAVFASEICSNEFDELFTSVVTDTAQCGSPDCTAVLGRECGSVVYLVRVVNAAFDSLEDFLNALQLAFLALNREVVLYEGLSDDPASLLPQTPEMFPPPVPPFPPAVSPPSPTALNLSSPSLPPPPLASPPPPPPPSPPPPPPPPTLPPPSPSPPPPPTQPYPPPSPLPLSSPPPPSPLLPLRDIFMLNSSLFSPNDLVQTSQPEDQIFEIGPQTSNFGFLGNGLPGFGSLNFESSGNVSSFLDPVFGALASGISSQAQPFNVVFLNQGFGFNGEFEP